MPLVGPPLQPLLSEADQQDLLREERRLQFASRPRRASTPPKFLPEWAVLDKKVLRFKGYFTEQVEGGRQVCCVRPVIIYYYLVDDAIAVTEPRTPNSGLDQGRQLSRQRVPHPDGGFWHWTHLNLGETLNLYGRHYVICDCDPFTKEYLLSEGTELGSPVPIPPDPYTLMRQSRAETPHRTSDLRPHSAPQIPPQLRGILLKFDVMVEEMENSKSTANPAVLLYRPQDLTVELRQPSYFDHTEIRKFSPVILRAIRVPLRDSGGSFVNIGEEGEQGEWLLPRHLIPPATVTIFGRRVLVTGCDAFTQRFLQDNYGADNVPGMKVIETRKPDESGSSGKTQSDIVPRSRARRGLLIPEDATVLRFSAKLHPSFDAEGDRSFILIYHVVDATLELSEKARPGGLGGRTLSRMRVPKPQTEGDRERSWGPDFYTLDDIYIGAPLTLWGQQYLITGADRHVLNYARQHEDQVSPQLLSSLMQHFNENSRHQGGANQEQENDNNN